MDREERVSRRRVTWAKQVLECGLERTTENTQLLRHLRVLNSMLLVAMGLCPPLGLFWASMASTDFAFLYLASFFAWGAIFSVVRQTQDPVLGGRLACAVLYGLTVGSAFLLGGAQSYALAWLMVLPVAAAVCVGSRDLWSWACVSAVTVLGFSLWVPQTGPTPAAFALDDPSSLISLVAGVGVVALLTHVWHAFQSDLANRLDASLQSLKKEVGAKELLVEIATISNAEDSVENAAKVFLEILMGVFEKARARYWVPASSDGPGNLRCLVSCGGGEIGSPHPEVVRCLEEPRGRLRTTEGESQLCVPVLDDGEVTGVLEVRCAAASDSLELYASVVSQMALRLAEVGLRESAVRAVWNEAHHDHLTRLPNRRAFHGVLERVLSDSKSQRRRAGLLFVDLNGFKHINDSLGHRAGDEVLRQVSRRLMRCLRLSDALCEIGEKAISPVSRVGGDEFTIVLDEIQNSADAEIVASRVVAALREPIMIDAQEVGVGASIGIAIYPDDAETLDGLVGCADSAMYTAKRRGGSGFARYRSGGAGFDEIVFEADLRTALIEGQLEMHYQPIFAVETGDLLGGEALMRWTHPEDGPISPRLFLPIAERLGLMAEVGRYQFETALDWFEQNRSNFPTGFRIALNLSPGQAKDAEFVRWLAKRLGASSLDSQCIELEVTEAALQDEDDETREHLGALRALGVTIALDDFGTGPSSLSLAKRFPISRIQLDRSLVEGLPDDPDDLSIASAVIGLSKALGVPLVAEGVENEAQHTFLAERGCEEMQGFLLAYPLPGDDFAARYGQRR